MLGGIIIIVALMVIGLVLALVKFLAERPFFLVLALVLVIGAIVGFIILFVKWWKSIPAGSFYETRQTPSYSSDSSNSYANNYTEDKDIIRANLILDISSLESQLRLEKSMVEENEKWMRDATNADERRYYQKVINEVSESLNKHESERKRKEAELYSL